MEKTSQDIGTTLSRLSSELLGALSPTVIKGDRLSHHYTDDPLTQQQSMMLDSDRRRGVSINTRQNNMIYISEYSLENATNNLLSEPLGNNLKISLSKSQSMRKGKPNSLEIKKYKELWDKLSNEDNNISVDQGRGIDQSIEEMRKHTHKLSSQIEIIKNHSTNLDDALEQE
jgi:restriction endonuclease